MTSMVSSNKAITPNRSVQLLHPKAKAAFIRLEQDLIRLHQAGRTEFRIEVFEGFRDPYRQDHLFREGSTKARAWESPHQYGLAMDFRPMRDGACWGGDLEFPPSDVVTLFVQAVKAHDLRTSFDYRPFHVWHPLWDKLFIQLR